MTSPAVTLLAQIENLEHGATPGKWIAVSDCDNYAIRTEGVIIVESENHHPLIGYGQHRGGVRHIQNAEFIAESRELVPRMLHALEIILKDAEWHEQHCQNQCSFAGTIRNTIERELGGDQ